MRTIAIANQKGGVGKTTTALSLAASLAELNHHVLLIDFDPQANATTGLGFNAAELSSSVYTCLLSDDPVEKAIQATHERNLSLMPSSIDLAAAEVELAGMEHREFMLRNMLAPLDSSWDYVIIDSPPSLGLLTLNTLTAAHEVIIPIQSEYYALEGLTHLLRTISLVKQRMNPDLSLLGILVTMYDKRTILSAQVKEELDKHFGEIVFTAVIPRSIRMSEAPSYGKTILEYDTLSAGAEAYRRLAKEVESREHQ
ncbi:MAG: ParA family protein [Candidatus Cryosericum sp.]|nr:ParA family protein [bacterium]